MSKLNLAGVCVIMLVLFKKNINNKMSADFVGL